MKLSMFLITAAAMLFTLPAFADQDAKTAKAIENGATNINAAPIEIKAKSPLAEMLTSDTELSLPNGASADLKKKSENVEITAADYISSINALKESLSKLEFEGGSAAELVKLTGALKKASAQLAAFESARTEYVQEKTVFVSDKTSEPAIGKTGH